MRKEATISSKVVNNVIFFEFGGIPTQAVSVIAENLTGSAEITVTVRDPEPLAGTDTFTFTVSPDPDAPELLIRSIHPVGSTEFSNLGHDGQTIHIDPVTGSQKRPEIGKWRNWAASKIRAFRAKEFDQHVQEIR